MASPSVPAEIIEKIRKCFNLTKSNWEGEAATALKMATELMERYGLEQADIDMEEGHEHINEARVEQAETDLKDLWPWEKDLVGVIHYLFGVEHMMVPAYGKKGYKIRFIGVSSQAVLAVEVYKILKAEVLKLSRGEGTEQEKREFRTGCVTCLNSRTYDIHKAREQAVAQHTASTSQALVVVKQQDLKAYVKEHFDTTPMRDRGSAISGSGAYERGHEAGEAINLDFQKGLK